MSMHRTLERGTHITADTLITLPSSGDGSG
jgi:hypothetical protein